MYYLMQFQVVKQRKSGKSEEKRNFSIKIIIYRNKTRNFSNEKIRRKECTLYKAPSKRWNQFNFINGAGRLASDIVLLKKS